MKHIPEQYGETCPYCGEKGEYVEEWDYMCCERCGITWVA